MQHVSHKYINTAISAFITVTLHMCGLSEETINLIYIECIAGHVVHRFKFMKI